MPFDMISCYRTNRKVLSIDSDNCHIIWWTIIGVSSVQTCQPHSRVRNPQTYFVIPLHEYIAWTMQSVFSASCGTDSHDTRQFTRGRWTNWHAHTLDNKSLYFILFYSFPSGKIYCLFFSHFQLCMLFCFLAFF